MDNISESQPECQPECQPQSQTQTQPQIQTQTQSQETKDQLIIENSNESKEIDFQSGLSDSNHDKIEQMPPEEKSSFIDNNADNTDMEKKEKFDNENDTIKMVNDNIEDTKENEPINNQDDPKNDDNKDINLNTITNNDNCTITGSNEIKDKNVIIKEEKYDFIDSNQTPKKDEKEEKYSAEVKEKPENLFNFITEERIEMWKSKLSHSASRISVNDSDILNTILTHEYQNVIKVDSERTRVREAVLIDSFRDYVEYFITYYCKQEKIQYKQGLNEIFGPFILLKYKISISLSNIYILCKRFIDKFLTNYYRSMYTIALLTSLNLFTILLKYHEPSIFHIFEKNLIRPEMYATSWILTLFANKFKLDVIYQLWDYLITLEDNLMVLYIMVAIIQLHKEQLLACDVIYIPKILCRISISSVEEVHYIVQKALVLRELTPYSFRIFVNNLELYKLKNPQLQQAYNLYRPDNILAMPFFPNDLFYHTYKSIVNCPDNRCFVTKNMEFRKVEKDNKIENHQSHFVPLIKNKDHICEHCDWKNVKRISYMLLDLRILEWESFEEWNEKTGFLPNMIMVPQNELKKPDFSDEIIARFKEDKETVHFVFMTSETDYFRDYEKDFYLENNIEIALFSAKFATQTKTEKELNIEKVNSVSNKAFIKADFPYVSYAYGGYTNVHNEALRYDITLLNHENKCHLCKKLKKHSKIPKMSKYTASFYEENSLNPNENDSEIKGNTNILISNSKIIIPYNFTISSTKKLNNTSTFQSYNISRILETYLTQMINSSDTHFIECAITTVTLSNSEVIQNCLLVMNNHEFQIYKRVPSLDNDSEEEELNYIDKYLFIDIIKVDYDKKNSGIIINLEEQKQLVVFMNSNGKARTIYKLIQEIKKK